MFPLAQQILDGYFYIHHFGNQWDQIVTLYFSRNQKKNI